VPNANPDVLLAALDEDDRRPAIAEVRAVLMGHPSATRDSARPLGAFAAGPAEHTRSIAEPHPYGIRLHIVQHERVRILREVERHAAERSAPPAFLAALRELLQEAEGELDR